MESWKKLFSKLNTNNNEERKMLRDRRYQWDMLVVRATNIFNDIITCSKEASYYQRLFIVDSYEITKWEGERYKNINTISLQTGSCLTDMSARKINNGMMSAPRTISERGATFTIMQLPNGGVAFIFSPSYSEVHNERTHKLIKVYKQPLDVTDDDILRAVKGMLKYGHNTSYYKFYPFSRYAIEYLKQYKREVYLMMIGAMAGAILSLVVTEIFATFKHNNDSEHKQKITTKL